MLKYWNDGKKLLNYHWIILLMQERQNLSTIYISHFITSKRQWGRSRTSVGWLQKKPVMPLEAFYTEGLFAISRINGTANLLVTGARTAECCQKAAGSAWPK